MKRKILTLGLGGAALLISLPVMAQDDFGAMLKKSGCTACHAIDKKVVGPSYNDVAEKYKGDASARAMLIEKVKKGGKGVWGNVPMPPNSPRVSDADIEKLVDGILALKK
ncbi:MAG: c-type cytochrome [Pseudomonadota bacterium]